jgi:ribosomal-protein-alanine N-acetyltransferase
MAKLKKEKEMIYMKNIGTIELETNRLLFRKASTSDSKNMFNNWASDKEVTKYLSWNAYEKEENAVSYLKYLEEEYIKDNFYNWIVVSKEDNTPIGTIGAVGGASTSIISHNIKDNIRN